MVVIRRSLENGGLSTLNVVSGPSAVRNRFVLAGLRVEQFSAIGGAFPPRRTAEVVCGDFLRRWGRGHALRTGSIAWGKAGTLSMSREFHDHRGRLVDGW
jgi:hypothetical protein